jgi:hypothetical protein
MELLISTVPVRASSRVDNADPTGLPRAGLSPNHDLHVVVERDLELQIAMVAGARNPLNLEFVWAAA